MEEMAAAASLRDLKFELNRLYEKAKEVERVLAAATDPLPAELEYARTLLNALRDANVRVPDAPRLELSRN